MQINIDEKGILKHWNISSSYVITRKSLLKKTAEFIVRYLESSYKDSKGYHRLTLSHSNPHINLVNSVANWHIGKKFQNKNHLDFLEYTRELNHLLLGEKAPLANTLKNILHQ